MQIKVRNRKLLISSFRLYSQLYSYLRLQTCFRLISVKFAAVLRKKIFKKKMQDGGQDGGHVLL